MERNRKSIWNPIVVHKCEFYSSQPLQQMSSSVREKVLLNLGTSRSQWTHSWWHSSSSARSPAYYWAEIKLKLRRSGAPSQYEWRVCWRKRRSFKWRSSPHSIPDGWGHDGLNEASIHRLTGRFVLQPKLKGSVSLSSKYCKRKLWKIWKNARIFILHEKRARNGTWLIWSEIRWLRNSAQT